MFSKFYSNIAKRDLAISFFLYNPKGFWWIERSRRDRLRVEFEAWDNGKT